jgi:ATP-dependent helicase Lhr and Lhr-like helicase
VVSDSFAGIRALLIPIDRRKPFSGKKHRGRVSPLGIHDAGRWSLVSKRLVSRDVVIEHITRTVLGRYGVIFWRMLEREATWLPPWRDMLRVLRRLEARGEIRGGRFVVGVSGEQYALPEALVALRNIRKQPLIGRFILVSGADPLNLVGILAPGPKVSALTANRILYQDGIPIGVRVAGEIRWLQDLDPAIKYEAKKSLTVNTQVTRRMKSLLASYIPI